MALSRLIFRRFSAAATSSPLKRTPLYKLHVGIGAKMVPFAGWEMPVQYKEGVLASHHHTFVILIFFIELIGVKMQVCLMWDIWDS